MIRLQPLFLALALLPVLGCGSSGGAAPADDVAAAGATKADLVLVSSGENDLLGLYGTLREACLVTAAGERTANLLGGPIAFELTGLGTNAAWISSAEIAPGTYAAVDLAFDPNAFYARTSAGIDTPLFAPTGEVRASFAEPVEWKDDQERRIDLLVDLNGALATPGTLELSPAVVEVFATELPALAVDEFFGVVTGASVQDKALIVEAFVDDDLTLPLGRIGAVLAQDALLVGPDGSVYPMPRDFFAALSLGVTVVEIQGELPDSGPLIATRVRNRGPYDSGSPGGSDEIVEIEGRIVALTPETSTLELCIREIEKGADIAEPVLAELGDPDTIRIRWDATTRFFVGGAVGDGGDLVLGQEIEVAFAEFSREPFPAARIDLADECTTLSGVLESVDAEAGSVVVRLSKGEPLEHCPGGIDGVKHDEDEDEDEDDDDHGGGGGELLTVLIGEADLLLDVHGKPALSIAELVPGMRVRAKGCFVDPCASALDARTLRVHPGHLIHADVASVDPAAGRFETSSSHVVQSFGFDVPKGSGGPLHVVVDAEARFLGKAHSLAALAELLDESHGVHVKIKGVGDSDPQTVRAFEVKVKLDD